MKIIKISNSIWIKFGKQVFYGGINSEKTFTFFRPGFGNVYYPLDAKKIILEGKSFSVVNVTPEEISLEED